MNRQLDPSLPATIDFQRDVGLSKQTRCPNNENISQDQGWNHNLVTRPQSRLLTKKVIRQPSQPGQMYYNYYHQAKLPALPMTLFNMSDHARNGIFYAFMQTYFGPNPEVNADDDSWYLLMTQFPQLSPQSTLFTRSVIALAAVYLGKRTDNVSLTRHGMEIYTSALDEMRRAIRRNNRQSPMLVLTSIVFHTYETIHNTKSSLQNCFNHISGGTALIEADSAHFSINERLEKALITRQKWATLFVVLNARDKPNLDWKCLRMRQEIGPLDELFVLIANILDFRADLATVKGLPATISREIREPILYHCHKLERKVRVDWMAGAAHLLDDNPLGIDVSKLTSRPNPSPSDQFKSLKSAKLHLLYWITLAVIHLTIFETETLMQRDPDPQHMLLYAGHIYRAVTYCMHPKNRMSSAHAVLLGISQASKCYIASREKGMFMRCQDVYHKVGTHGIELALQMGEEDWKLWHNGGRPTRQDSRN